MITVKGFSNGCQHRRVQISSNSTKLGAQFDWKEKLPVDAVLDPIAADIVRIAQGIHLADRSIRRNLVLGKRVRRIDVTMDVRNPDHWTRHAPALERIISFVSADEWSLRFTRAGRGPKPSRRPLSRPRLREGVVALFSGGLDSLCGAALRAEDGSPTCFVTHSPPGTKRVQELLSGVWKAKESRTSYERASFMLRPLRRDEDGRRCYFPETTRRSRPLYFLLLAVATARQLGIRRVQMSENGALAMNLPFRADAHGGTIARQAHCWMLTKTAEWLDAAVPMRRPWDIFNPFEMMTKGEACRLLGSASQLTRKTESCEYVRQQAGRIRNWKAAHPRLARKLGNGPQCGACLPCIIRRSALMAAGIEDPDGDYFFYAPALLERARSASNRVGSQPPLEDNLTTHPFYLARFVDSVASSKPAEFMERYLPELRLLRSSSGSPMTLPRDAHRLTRRLAHEIGSFLIGRS